MKTSMSVMSLLLTLLLITEEYVMAKLTMTQSSSEVIVGGTTRMSCVTTLQKEIYWFHFLPGSSEQRAVYAYGKMHSPYKERFNINITAGFYGLTIPRVELTDAGVYVCHEDDGGGDSDRGELTVLESGPTCTSTKNPLEFIGPNSCNKQQENLTLTCSIAYRGNIDPLLEWKMVGSNDAVTQGINVEKTENRITIRLTVHSKPAFDGSSFICRTTQSRDNCTSDVINVIYAISSDFTQDAAIGDTVVCNANTNESRTYKWKWFKGDDTLTVSNNQILIPKQAGNFRCEADYFIRKQPCTVIAMFASVEGGNATYTAEEPAVGSRYIVVIVIVIVIVMTFAVIFSVLGVSYFLRKKKKQREEMSKEFKVLLMPEYKGVIMDRDEIPKYYAQMSFIEKGSSGEINGPFVFQGIKCMCEKILHAPADVSSATEDKVCSQGRNWMALDHKNILKFYDVLFKFPALFVVMDYAEGGSVRKALNSCTEDLEVRVVKDWATQIADGMNYLHTQKIIHGGLKAVQILIMEPFHQTNPSPKTLRITSYKLTRDQGESAPGSYQGMCAWMAPEDVKGDPTSKASDVWSYGVTVWEILTRKIPYRDVRRAALIRGLAEGNLTLCVPTGCPEAIQDVLNGCWERDVNSRPTFSQIMSRLHTADDVIYENGV